MPSVKILTPALAAAAATLLVVGLACRPAAPARPIRPPPSRPLPVVREPLPPPVMPAAPLPAEPVAATLAAPRTVRVGLATDLDVVSLPCCDPRVVAQLEGAALPLGAATRVEPSAEVGGRVVYRLQVAALKDDRQAAGVADTLRGSSGLDADVVFDAAADLYKVRVGRYPTREEADAARRGLAGLGVTEAWVVSEGGALTEPALVVVQGSRRWTVPGRWLAVEAPAGLGLPWNGGRYRGRLLVFLSARGRLNVVEELGIEDYLRGVVPREMGPDLYGQLEALKAQAVAARTFTVRNLGEFRDEGYDICSTPRCQVYGGMAAEHPVSDRAVAETADEIVLFHGEPTETFYSATCGGHTEDVSVVFPLKRGAYLQGVPCIEAGAVEVQGSVPPGLPFPAGLARELLPPAPGRPAQVLAARLEHLALLAGLPVPRDRLRSIERREVARFVGSVFDLGLDRRLLSTPAELAALVAAPPPEWRGPELRLATWLRDAELLRPELAAEAVGDAEAEELLWRLAVYLGLVVPETVHHLGLAGGTLEVRDPAGNRRRLPLPPSFATFARAGDGLVTAALELYPSDVLDLYWYRDRLLALVQAERPGRIALGDRGARGRWTRFVSAGELRRQVGERYPGFPFTGFEVVERGVSGRVGRLRLLGGGGRTVDVEGLAVRWTLGLPDTQFQADSDPARDGWTFRGRGWGHGVGLCQVGAFAMAQRGRSYREILEHYYTGVDLGRRIEVASSSGLGP